MQLHVRYLCSFNYHDPVRESHNLLRVCPAETPTQRLLSFDLHIEPSARLLTYVDYWGTRVDAFGIRHPHDQLLVAATSLIETDAPVQPDEYDVPFSSYRSDEVRRGFAEYLQETRHTSTGARLMSMAADAIGSDMSALEALVALEAALTGPMRYEPGSTFVGVDVNEVLEQGAGVCQDFAHLLMAGCRSVGIPARYVSGYLYEGTESEFEVEAQTHAWMEAFIPGWGWFGIDPTNPGGVGDLHVKIGHGRDYDDVPPLRGLFHGTGTHDLGVSVRISKGTLSAISDQQ
ncbi:MAG: transglutaminase family protein [Acidimicrobiia bacterium]|nr:transglutaminase family protein [Acidimicrobiia bacterium]